MGKLYAACFFVAMLSANMARSQNEQFSKRVINSSYNLNSAWEITYGPKDSLWVTENKAYLVSRINIANGSKTVLLDLLGTSGDTRINFSEFGSTPTGKKSTVIKRLKPAVWPQGGLMGMALHPNLFSTDPAVRNSKPWVYLAYVFDYTNPATCSGSAPCYFYSKIVRYTYNGNTLTSPVVLLDSIPGSNDHNSGRLKIGPDAKLYYTVGDMGAGQFNNTARANNALNLDIMEGKVLRLNTENDGGSGKDAWIPNDNPFYDAAAFTTRDYVFSYGHRNAQGLDWAIINNNPILFSSEHSDKSDDEVNIINAGKSYGWNRVSGYCDGNYDGLVLGGYSPVNEGAYGTATPDNKEPLFTTFTATPAEISRFTGDMFTFKTIAPSSIEVYKSSSIPGWQNSVLVPALKGGRVYRMKLDDSTGSSVIMLPGGVDTAAYFAGQGRFRDLAISPDGLKIYVACDLSGATSGPTGGFNSKINTAAPPNAGKILEFTYSGAGIASRMAPAYSVAEATPLFRVYPNPATDRVTINSGGVASVCTIEVFDLNGRLIKKINSLKSVTDVNTKGMAAGVYTIRVTDRQSKVLTIQKIIKQ